MFIKFSTTSAWSIFDDVLEDKQDDEFWARTGDMSMGRNLFAARCLDFTDKDDDDGLHQHHDDDKDKGDEEENQVSIKPRNAPRRPAAGNLVSSSSSNTVRKASVSVKRPLELPCQEIRYLEIPYQKVGTLSISMPQMDFSPIPWKKINYHPVLHHTIHYVDVQYCGERPNKRKPLGRSRSFAAVADLKEKVDSEWIYKFR
ncbi:uncharacterized protein LOC143026340 isoform X3 [Oratosquilla oratoria]|uniref:uncharacterized protein LOC143026340 isoform X3 n=1 Tax=Oratosquilla oratoria TaxID=337810 RepID=UPI003F75AFF8